MVAVLVMVATLGGAAPVAWASLRGEPIYGDVNGDGYTDRSYLGSVRPDTCSVIVQYGLPGGAFRPPIAYTYLRPGLTGPETPCPDLGVAVELNVGSDAAQLVIGWFAGPPSTIDYNLLVLTRDFLPAFGLTQAIFQPSLMDQADFNGDGRVDVYSVTDQGQGFETYLSLGNGTLTIGPERWCSGRLAYQLRDFDGDGAMDTLISYIEGCTDGSTGVVVLLDDGTYQLLQHDVLGLSHWTATVAFADANAIPDVRTQSTETGEVEYFIGTGTGTFVQSPHATPDRVTISGNRRTEIPVLANDYATTTARISITTPPSYGTVQVTSARTVIYTPNATHPASDRFVYRLTEDGRTSSAPVAIGFTG